MDFSNMRGLISLILITLVGNIWILTDASVVQIPHDLTEKVSLLLTRLVNDDGLSHSKLQEIYDDNFNLFEEVGIDGTQLIETAVADLGSRFMSAIDALTKIRTALESSYASFTSSQAGLVQCCYMEIEDLEFNEKFNSRVDLEEICIRIAQQASNNPTMAISQEIVDTVFSKNVESSSGLYWQYYGTEEGVLFMYPGQQAGQCQDYDPRFRPWYAETTTSAPKDVVIVLDRSESMQISNVMDLAKEAAKTVVDTLNPNDRFGFVLFSDSAFPPSIRGKYDCLSSELAFATPAAKMVIKDYISTIKPKGGTKYLPALQAAFRFLNTTQTLINNGTKRDRAILFLTDGKPADSSAVILNYLNLTKPLGVKLFIYGLGEADSSAKDILQTMASDHYGNSGIYTPVLDERNLRFDMGRYYSAFVKAAQIKEATITVPYVDAFGLGLVTTIAIPIYHNSNLMGVAGIDFNWLDLINEILYSFQGTQSYSFMIHGSGRVMLHPLLPHPADLTMYGGDWESVFVGIDTLETGSDVKEIIPSMTGGQDDEKLVSTSFITSKGQSDRNGIYQEIKNANYIWRKVPNTNFSVCFVIPTDARTIGVGNLNSGPVCKQFIYYRLDLMNMIEKCSFMERITSTDGPMTLLTPDAFVDPVKHINRVDDKETVNRYKEYMEGNDVFGEDQFKDNVRPMVALTEGITEFWKGNFTYKKQIIWTYVGLTDGAFMHYPAIAYDGKYDHTIRPWYKKAIANKGKIVLSAPYTDAGLAGTIMTICKTLYIGRENGHHTDMDHVIGVIGMDLKLDTLSVLIEDNFQFCTENGNSCFMVDNSGYLVYHSNWVHLTHPEEIENLHMMKAEPYISHDLITKGHLTKQECDSLEKKQTYFNWKLSIEDGIEDNIDAVPSYYATLIPATNVYFFVVDRKQISQDTCNCGEYGEILTCKSQDCECPCTTILDFEYCKNTGAEYEDRPGICIPDSFDIVYKSPIQDEKNLAKLLPLCYIENCTALDERSCKASSSCNYCPKSVSSRCQLGRECTGIGPTPGPKDPPNLIIIGAGAGGGAVILGIIIAVICIQCKKRNAKGDNREPLSNLENMRKTTTDTKIDKRPDSRGTEETNIYSEITGSKPGQVNPVANDVYMTPLPRQEFEDSN